MRSLTRILLLGSLLTLAASSTLAQAVSSILTSVVENNSPADSQSANNLRFGDQFVAASAIADSDGLFTLLDPSTHAKTSGKYFIGRASYQMTLPPVQLTAAVFQSVEILKYLLGSEYDVKLISQNPFQYQAVRHVSILGVINQDIESTAEMQVFDYAKIPDPHLKQLVANFSIGHGAPVRVIYQNMSGFNKYITKAFLLTLIYANTSGGSQVELFSGSALNEADLAGLPSFATNRVITSIADGDLTGYAQRLSRVK